MVFAFYNLKVIFAFDKRRFIIMIRKNLLEIFKEHMRISKYIMSIENFFFRRSKIDKKMDQ